jgi:(S)-2-hydroxyglutarate dehydrogenase
MAGSPSDRADVVIVGGGIVGLATALRLLERRPGLRLTLLEREAQLATHQSGHNSGVVHAGLYYAPGSAKARLCREGKAELEAYCERKGIPIQQTGKLVVAASSDQVPRLEGLRERAEANGVPGLELIGPEQIREHEPHATGLRALWSPTTGIVDFRRIALAYADDVRALGGTIETTRPMTAVRRRGDELILATPRGDLVARSLIVCAGLWADVVAAQTGDAGRGAPRIIPFRGDYYTFTPDARPLVRGLIYPVPDPRFPFLGVHLTKRHDGEVWAGPNAVLAFKRTGYRRRDVSIRDLASTFTYPGFLRLAARYYRVGAAEMWRDWNKRAFLAEIRRYVPAVRGEQIRFGPSGVRAQALGPDGTLVDDFDLAGSGRVLHVRNAPSPAATSSLAIGSELARRAIERFELG